MLRPKSIDTLKTYYWKQFKNAIISGIIVGIAALLLACLLLLKPPFCRRSAVDSPSM
ncbi:MAG: hypothetical protein KC900_13550 [Candidatus Omnitrophica bacterium]|nr:hypothetical protein [Candidatus Omnitrophota bacterium]